MSRLLAGYILLLFFYSCKEEITDFSIYYESDLVSSSYGAVLTSVENYDNLLFCPHGSKIYSFEKTGNTYREEIVYEEKQLDGHGLSRFDIDFDGQDELVLSTGARKGTKKGKGNKIFEVNQGKLKARKFPRKISDDKLGRTRCVLPADIDLDGALDFFIVNYSPKKFASNKVYLKDEKSKKYNEAEEFDELKTTFSSHFVQAHLNRNSPVLIGQFQGFDSGKIFEYKPSIKKYKDISKEIGVTKVEGIRCMLPFDKDNDGDVDLVAISDKVGSKKNKLTVFEYHANKFKIDTSLFIENPISTLLLGDFDNNGFEDIFLIEMDHGSHPRILHNVAGKLEDHNVIFPKTILKDSINNGILLDLEANGSQDLFLYSGYRNSKGKHYFLKNENEDQNNFIKLDLEGLSENNGGGLAKIEIQACGQKIYRQNYIGNVFYGHQNLPLHIGIGNCEEVDIKVLWWKGKTTKINVKDVNQLITVKYPS